MATKKPEETTVTASPSQVLTGIQVGAIDCRAVCTGCGAHLGEGETVTIYAYQLTADPEFQPSRLYCRGCKPCFSPTLGAAEVLADATLSITALCEQRHHALTLSDVQVNQQSRPEEGSQL